MLKSVNRLRQHKDFKEMGKKGKNVYSPLFNLRYLIVLENDTKFAIVISKKISKKAVVRNRIKRQIREIVRLEIKNNTFKDNLNIVIYTKRLIIDKKYSEIEKELKYLFKKARILK